MLDLVVGLKTILVAGLVVSATVTGIRFNHDLKAAEDKLASYTISESDTSHGNVTYAYGGKGIPLLAIHGICGGFDQGYDIGEYFSDKGFRVIAPSRFGYPGSDLPKGDASPKAQADAFRQLLDTLHIEKVFVLATSAGGPSGLRFALDYPERTSGLILQCANVPTPPTDFKNPPDFIYNDFPMWAAVKVGKNSLLKMFGIDPAAYNTAPASERAGLEKVFSTLLPMSRKRAGILNDNRVTNPDTSINYNDYKLESIRLPVFFINAKDDPMAKFPGVEAAYRRIPGAELKAFETGGHPMFGHGREGDDAVLDFIRRHTV